MRNPNWHRDEIILALDLYFSPDRGSIDRKNPKMAELSILLNQLPLFSDKPDEVKFRNVNGVVLKLTNFLAIDPSHEGDGMKSYSALDKKIFYEFSHDRLRLHTIASKIKEISANQKLREKIGMVENDEEMLKDSVSEGQILYKLHKVRERDKSIVRSKKRQALILYGHLQCEVCMFDFERAYGGLGSGYIECHHKTPLFRLNAESKTRLEDLALVCSNCHRMLHKSIDSLTIDELKEKIKYAQI